MTCTDTADAKATIAQIHELVEVGCEIVRIAVPDQAAADALPEIVAGTPVPLIADIHFDYRWALAAIGPASTACASTPATSATPTR